MSTKTKPRCWKCDDSGIIYPEGHRPDAEYLDSTPDFCDCKAGDEAREHAK